VRKLTYSQGQEPGHTSEPDGWRLPASNSEPAPVENWLAQYRPRTIDAVRWESLLRAFVVSSVLALNPGGTSIAGRYVRALTRLANWCLTEGLLLDVEVVLDPDTVERFASTLPKNKSTATYRADLRRIGRRLTKNAPWEPRPEPIIRRAVAPPYSPDELAQLRRFAANQSTDERRRRATALIALGAGAGLDGRWSTRIRPGDLLRTPGGLVVRVSPPNPRHVPVLASFASDLEWLLADPSHEVLVGGAYRERNRASDVAARLDPAPGLPRLSSGRLRSTWLVHHLTAGTRLPELAEAAGLVGVTVLSDLMAFIPRLSRDEADQQLRGGTR
jgi:hypothetical protein